MSFKTRFLLKPLCSGKLKSVILNSSVFTETDLPWVVKLGVRKCSAFTFTAEMKLFEMREK